MPLFHYKALTTAGETVTGEMEADTEAAVIAQLRASGHLPVSAVAVTASPLRAWLGRSLFTGRVGSRDLALLTRELATLLEAGVMIDRALAILGGLAEKRALRDMLADLRTRVQGGASLAEAMEAQGRVFPTYYVNMVRAGEASGQLEGVLARLADFLERSRELTGSVRSALIYPAVLVGMAVLSLVIVLVVVLPTFEPMFKDAGRNLPAATQVVRALGYWTRDYWWVAVAICTIAALWVRRDLATTEGRMRWHGLALRTPVVGKILTRIAFARFARMLGTLLASGVGVLAAMGHARQIVSNEVMARALDKVTATLKEGGGLARPLAAAGVFPRLAVDLVSVGEETGRLEDMLVRAADIYEREVTQTLDRALALLVPVLTLALGVLIAALIGSVLVAILSVNELAL